jgi:hypothetical protein
MKTVAQKFKNFINTLGGGAQAGVWQEKVVLPRKELMTSDNWLLSELRMNGFGSGSAEGVACFYREKVLAVYLNGSRNYRNF